MDTEDREIVQTCKKLLAAHYGSRFKGLILYGSMARGTADPESDIDLLVLLEEPFDFFAELEALVDLLYGLQMKSPHHLSTKPVNAREYRAGRIQLYRNAHKEGGCSVSKAPQEEIAAHALRARWALEAAQALCEKRLYDDAASRAYYAAFHAASAALMARGMTFRKHGALMGAVHKHLVHTGEASVETGKWITWLFELRAVGDYGEVLHVDKEQALLAVSRTETLVNVFLRLAESN